MSGESFYLFAVDRTILSDPEHLRRSIGLSRDMLENIRSVLAPIVGERVIRIECRSNGDEKALVKLEASGHDIIRTHRNRGRPAEREGARRRCLAGPVSRVLEASADIRGAHSEADPVKAGAVFSARKRGHDRNHSRKTKARRARGKMHRVPELGSTGA